MHLERNRRPARRRRHAAGRLPALCLLACLLPGAGATAERDAYLGRPIADIIEEFRQAGEPFAYSTNLVTPDLVVTAEPTPGEPLDVVRQILTPHGLTIRSASGVYLVVRSHEITGPPGRLLLMIRATEGDRDIAHPDVSSEPQLPEAIRLASGVYQYGAVSPRSYRVVIAAPGFLSLTRQVRVLPGETAVLDVTLKPSPPEIETITVSASRYEISRDPGSSPFLADRQTIETMPDLGEDPVRITQRLPGAAASGASAVAHFRGGEEREVGIILNGQPLFDPFHVRDYQNIFSTVDSRAIEGVEVYTGGFPVRYGDRMSGVVLMESLEPDQPRYTELGVSVFNTSVLLAGRQEARSWLVSARRGNLDLVIDPQYGRPSYYDFFAALRQELSPHTTLSANVLFASDLVTVVLESDPEEREQVESDTTNAHLWLQVDSRWSDALSSSTVLSAVTYRNRRTGIMDDVEKMVANVRDDREVSEIGFRQNWTWLAAEHHLMQWGLSAMRNDADYDYASSAEYFGLLALYPAQPGSISRQFATSPNGGSYAVWFADRWKLAAKTIFEWGLRWDDQTYTDLSSDSQVSPRFSVLHSVGERAELRLSWGRYHQSQGIHEMQIEDGITRFWPAEQADHLIAGLRYRIDDGFSMRLELFDKRMTGIRPRFENLFDPLGLIPELQPDRVRIDAESAHSRGVELSFERSAGDWDSWGAYTWSRATDRIDGADIRRSWDQRHTLQAGIGWSNETWNVNFAAGIHSGWPTTELTLVEDGVDADGEPVLVAVPGERNARHHGTFASVDMRIGRNFDIPRGRLSAFVEVSNLLNRRNECCLDWDLVENAAGNEVLERGVDYWLPLLPAIGVLWQF